MHAVVEELTQRVTLEDVIAPPVIPVLLIAARTAVALARPTA